MKIAIFHNYLDNMGGAEHVVLTLARELKADVYTTSLDFELIKKMGYEDISFHTIGKVPINPPFRQQAALKKFSKLKLGTQYDFYIIAGDWAVSGLLHNAPNIWYAHSPIREIWDLYEYTRATTVPFHKRIFFDLWVRYNRHLTTHYVKKAEIVACNSETTQKRIAKYLNRDATVIFPPVDTSQYYFESVGDYWLSVNRLLPHKRIALQLNAFKKLPDEKLIIVGSYEKAHHFQKYASLIKKSLRPNVELISWVEKKALLKLYANCRGFITTSMEEDFGLTAIEAMASGKPVIAPNEGGYRQSILNNKTGILINNISEQKIVDAVNTINKNPSLYKDHAIAQAACFDTSIFIKKIKDHIRQKNG